MDNLILVINKEKGLTSRDVVNKLSKILNIKKIGHTGTLDPLASGVLVCVTNKWTKLVDLITSLDKEYIATIKLGIETDTLDINGNILKEEKPRLLQKEEIIKVLNSFKKEYEQEVPKYSAKSINGKRLYEYARENIDVELPRIKVSIKDIELLDYGIDFIKIKCLVSKGTYIRSLIRDICNKIGTIGTMSKLIRTSQGEFKIEDCIDIDEISDNKIIGIKNIINFPITQVDDNLKTKILNGQILENIYNTDNILFCDNNKKVLAIYKIYDKDKRKIKPYIMLYNGKE